MENVIIKEKIVVDMPPVAPKIDGAIISPKLNALASNYEFKIIGDDIVLTKVKKGSEYITIPLGVTKIGRGAFSGEYTNNFSTKIRRIIIPVSVYEIEDEAFAGNGYLENISMENSSVLKIGENAFAGCRNLYHVQLPKCVGEIGSYAFRNTGLKEIYVPRHTTLGDTVFDDKTVYLRGDSAYRDLLIGEYEKTVLNPKENELKEREFIIEQEERKKEAIRKLDRLKSEYKLKFRREKESKLTSQKLQYSDSDKKLENSLNHLNEVKRKYHALLYAIMNDKLTRFDVNFTGFFNENAFCKEVFSKVDSEVDLLSIDYTQKEISNKLKEVGTKWAEREIYKPKTPYVVYVKPKEKVEKPEKPKPQVKKDKPIETKVETKEKETVLEEKKQIDLSVIKNKADIIFESKDRLIVFKNKAIEVVGKFEFSELPEKFFKLLKKSKTIVFHGELSNWGEDNWKTFKRVKKIVVDNISTMRYDNFAPFKFLERVEIKSENKVEIAYSCFEYKKFLKEVKMQIEKGGAKIGEKAFLSCHKLKEFDFTCVTDIEKKAFAYCEKLSSTIESKNLTLIDSFAFQGCKKITEVYATDKDLSIRQNAFEGCRLKKAVVNAIAEKRCEIQDQIVLKVVKTVD